MKKGLILITAGLALLVCGATQAKANDITVSGVNIKDLVSNACVGLLYMPDGSKRKGIMSSRAAVKAFMVAMGGKPFTLTIRAAA